MKIQYTGALDIGEPVEVEVEHKEFDPLLVDADWDDPMDVAEKVARPLLEAIDRLEAELHRYGRELYDYPATP